MDREKEAKETKRQLSILQYELDEVTQAIKCLEEEEVELEKSLRFYANDDDEIDRLRYLLSATRKKLSDWETERINLEYKIRSYSKFPF